MFDTPIDFYGLFAFLSLFFCVVILIVFVLHNDWSRLSNRMLLLTLISFAAISSYVFLLQTEVPLYAPLLINAIEVFFFLVMPFAYLYISKWPAGTWRKIDFLHFLPALIFIVQLLLLHSSPVQENTYSDTNQLNAQAANIFPSLNFYMRGLQWLAYCMAMLFTYRKTIRKSLDGALINSKRMLMWLNLFIGILTITSVVPLAVNVEGDALFFALTSASAFVLCLFMLVNPEVLYGMPAKPFEITSLSQYLEETQDEDMEEINPDDIPQLKPKKISLSEEQVEYMDKKLHEFMFIRKPFLHQKYTLQQLSSDSGFPLYQLSLYLNRTLGLNFNSYINKMRIEFLLESYKHNQDKWNKFTLEAVAREIGFSNRTSFIQAFKKVTGSNPSVYFKNIHGHVISD